MKYPVTKNQQRYFFTKTMKLILYVNFEGRYQKTDSTIFYHWTIGKVLYVMNFHTPPFNILTDFNLDVEMSNHDLKFLSLTNDDGRSSRELVY